MTYFDDVFVTWIFSFLEEEKENDQLNDVAATDDVVSDAASTCSEDTVIHVPEEEDGSRTLKSAPALLHFFKCF